MRELVMLQDDLNQYFLVFLFFFGHHFSLMYLYNVEEVEEKRK